MNTANLTPDARAALVAIIRRAAQRGRELREQQQTATLDGLDSDQDGGHTPRPESETQNAF